VVTAVAVWDELPTAEQLLNARVERGWVPVPTPTKDGNVILGYAACRRW
jgi:hypothetical protein